MAGIPACVRATSRWTFLQEPAIPPFVADPNQLMQVFLNLLLNAEQAIRESREKGTIRVRIGRIPTGMGSCSDDGPESHRKPDATFLIPSSPPGAPAAGPAWA